MENSDDKMTVENYRKRTIEELTNLLKECKIDEYVLDTQERILEIKYKEDFETFFPKLNAEPMIEKNDYCGMYPFGLSAFFLYNGWTISGRITNYKNKTDS